ncbi:MAG: T9SS type A sorting domain-containing protein [Crocinitomix sp.]|nr:T9SS type A sorting domain-containing protein [Crocinitomix sp.]
MIKNIICTVTLLLSLGAVAQDFEELMMVVADDRDTEDRLGWSCDIEGDFAVVGAYADDYGATNPNMGSAYVYERTGGEWIQIQKLSNSDQDDYDRFGWDVEISGDFIIVGAYGEDHDTDDGALMSKAGSAYIFERGVDGVFEEVQKLVAADRAANDEFGWSVSIYGTTAIVGAHIDDKNAFGMGSFYHAGSAYIFDREDDGSWTQTQKIVASDRSPGTVYAPDHEDWNDRFGESVSIWDDYLVVGGPFASKAYAFERTGDTWTQVAFLTYPGISWLDRAAPVDIQNNTIVLGAQTEDLNADMEESILNSGGAAVFTRVDGTWGYLQRLSPGDRDAGDHFGISVGVDGDYIVVGAHSDNHDEDGGAEIENTGSVYIFELQDDGTYDELIKLDASDRAIDDELGISVAISESTIIVGAFQQDEDPDGGTYLEDAGAAYFYTNLDGGGGCDDVFFSQEIDLCAGEEIVVGESVYDESGVYTDVITTDLGCDSVITTILDIAEEIEVEQELFVCNGGFVWVGDSYYDETGSYIDMFESVDGCDSLVFTYLEVGDAIDTDVTVDEATLEAVLSGMDYQWITCDPFEIIDGATAQAFIAAESGDYAVIITDGDCADTSDCYTIVIDDDPGSGIEETAFSASITIYPNPSNGTFIINGEMLVGSQIQIYNSIGALVYETIANSNTQSVTLTNQAAGIYVLKVTSEYGSKIEKISLK